MHNILLIDKGTSSVSAFRKSLAGSAYRLIHAAGLKPALARLEKDSIDVITIEQSLFREAADSRNFARHAASLPKIIMTGEKIPLRTRRAWAKTGLTSILQEPCSFSEYRDTVKELIAAKSLQEKNSALEQGLRDREREISFYNEMLEMVSSTRDIKKTLNAIMKKTRMMTGASACSLLFHDDHLFEMLPVRLSKTVSRFALKKKSGIAGWVISRGEPLLVPDVKKDRRFNAKADTFAGLTVKSLLCAPLMVKERVVGLLRVANRADGSFSDQDLSLLRSAAGHLSTLIERAFLYEKLKNDELTNLFNSRHLNHILEMETERALRYNHTFSIIFMDIDNFKKINDRYGHLVGSRALVEIGDILRDNLRVVDIIARYGGDEFVVVLPQTLQDGCYFVAERLRKSIEKKVFLKEEGFSIRLTASLGIATFPDSARTKDELLDIADTAMYRGKFSTKNIVYQAK